MHTFNYSFLKDIRVPAGFMSDASSISACVSREEAWKKAYPEIFAKLAQASLVQSVTDSNAIEGITASQTRISGIVRNETVPIGDNEQQIAGYADALRYIRENHDSIPLDEGTILCLHSIMYSHTSSQDAGRYKTEDNVIAEEHADGSMHARWIPVSHEDTPYAMQQLLLAYTVQESQCDINKLLLIPCFILDFLCIHPFRDGNGRVSRLLTALLLYRSGYDIQTYFSIEAMTYKLRDWYYRRLLESSQGWHETENDYIPFISGFLSIMSMCCADLSNRFEAIPEGAGKNERIRKAVLDSIIPVSKKEICDALPDVSQTTVEAVLASMQKEGLITKTGSTRGARYMRK